MSKQNITERFFRAIGAEIKPSNGWPGYFCWVLNDSVISFSKVSCDWFFPEAEVLPYKYLPNITQSWPDFKKYVIPVMREKGFDYYIQPRSVFGAFWYWIGPDVSMLEIRNDEILVSAVGAAVQVLEGENE